MPSSPSPPRPSERYPVEGKPADRHWGLPGHLPRTVAPLLQDGQHLLQVGIPRGDVLRGWRTLGDEQDVVWGWIAHDDPRRTTLTRPECCGPPARPGP